MHFCCSFGTLGWWFTWCSGIQSHDVLGNGHWSMCCYTEPTRGGYKSYIVLGGYSRSTE